MPSGGNPSAAVTIADFRPTSKEELALLLFAFLYENRHTKAMEMVAKTIEETEKLAAQFVSELENAAAQNEATLVLLEGNLGSGKTAFTKGMAKALGVKQTVTSPTFIIEKVYDLKNSRFKKLIHIDAYRFEKAEEAAVLEFETLLKNPSYLIVVEWPERIATLIPERAHKIYFKFVDDSTRKIKIHGKDK